MNFDTSEILRRLENLIRIGTVTLVDGAFARARWDDEEDAETALLPWITARAGDDRTWHSLSEGEQVVIFAPGGDLAQGVLLAGLYQDSAQPPASDANIHRTTYADGTEISYDKSAHTLTAILCEGGKMEVTAPDGFTFNGDISHNGKLTVSETITAVGTIKSTDGDVADKRGTVEAVRVTYDGHTGHNTADTKPAQKMIE